MVETPSAYPSRHRRSLPLIVGRERAQALLREQLDQMLAGHGGLVLVSGEAGIGKTTLVEWLVAQAEESGALVLWGHVYDLSATPPYGPWVEIARRYRAAGQQASVPAFLDDPDAVSALGNQQRLVAEVAAFFTAAADRRPLVLVLEDLHWADRASLDLLRFLARQADRLPLLLLATYRSDEVSPEHPLYALLPALVREAKPCRVDLQRLTGDDVRELVRLCYGLDELGETRLLTFLKARAEGNPFFLIELLQSLEATAILHRADHGWTLGDLSAARLPALLRQVIHQRLARLSGLTQQLLGVAAVIGQEVGLTLWANVAGMDQKALFEVATRAVEAHLLEETVSGVRFIHALVRTAVYDEVPGVRRRIWHRRVAETLMAGAHPEPDAVAHHLQQAEDSRSAEWLIKAGDRARLAYALQTARERYGAALARLPESPGTDQERAWLLFRLVSLQRDRDPRQARVLLGEVARVAARATDRGLVAYLSFYQGLLSLSLADYQVGLAEARAGLAALELLSGVERSQLIAQIAATRNSMAEPAAELSMWLASVGHFAEARELAERTVASAATTSRTAEPGRLGIGTAFYALGMIYASTGLPTQARSTYTRARSASIALQELSGLHAIVQQEMIWVVLPFETDQLTRRRQLREEIERTAVTTGNVSVDPTGLRFSPPVPLLLLEGRWSEARSAAVSARAGMTGGAAKAVPIRALGPLAYFQGDTALAWELVREDLRQGPDTAPGTTIYPTSLALQRVAASLALDVGDLSTARAWLEAHDRWLDWADAVLGRAEGCLLWARYHRAGGERLLAHKQAAQALAYASAPRQPLALLAAHRLLGELAAGDKRFAVAEQHLQASLDLAQACAAPFERALTLLALAEFRVAQRQAAEARALLAEVRAICEPLEARPTLTRVDALAVRLERPRCESDCCPGGLTAREREVAALVAHGLSNRQIGEALFISEGTSSLHVKHILHKLGFSSRAQIAAWMTANGLTPHAHAQPTER